MDYAKPADVVTSMLQSAQQKLALGPRDLLIRGALSGALLGVATSLALTGAVSTNQPLVGAIVFPVGLIPTGMLLGARVSFADWWLWNQIPVTLGHLIGGFLFTGLALYLTHRPGRASAPVARAAHVPAE